MVNNVWIELEPPKGVEGLGEQRAEYMTKLLARLCDPEDKPIPVCRWNSTKAHYELIYGGMRIETLTDNGQWFNLEYFGRD